MGPAATFMPASRMGWLILSRSVIGVRICSVQRSRLTLLKVWAHMEPCRGSHGNKVQSKHRGYRTLTRRSHYEDMWGAGNGRRKPGEEKVQTGCDQPIKQSNLGGHRLEMSLGLHDLAEISHHVTLRGSLTPEAETFTCLPRTGPAQYETYVCWHLLPFSPLQTGT